MTQTGARAFQPLMQRPQPVSHGLDQAALEVCKQMGLAPEVFQAERERQLKGE